MADRASLWTIRWIIPISVVALVAAGSVLWVVWRPTSIEAAPSETHAIGAPTSAAPVEAARVLRGDLPLWAEATGYLKAWRKTEIGADASGRVVERLVEDGGRVAAGALLIRLDDRDRLIELEEARAEWLKAQAEYAVHYGDPEAGSREPVAASKDLDEEMRKAEQRLREGLISKRELEEIRRQRDAARVLSGAQRGEVRAATSGLAQAEQRVERARLALERTRILAPFAGRVADLAVEMGQQVSPGDPLLALLEDDRIKVDVDVLEADMVRIREGASARVRIPSLDNLTLEGSVHTINPKVDPETGTGRVTVLIPNPRRLLFAGLFATVELETRRLPDRLVVPTGALLNRQGRDLVFRIQDGRALWTYVRVGARSSAFAEITEGLSEGDLIATGGHFALAHEAPVEARILGGGPPASWQSGR